MIIGSSLTSHLVHQIRGYLVGLDSLFPERARREREEFAEFERWLQTRFKAPEPRGAPLWKFFVGHNTRAFWDWRVISIQDDVHVDSRNLLPDQAVVIGTIRHDDANVISLVFGDDASNPLVVTPVHPLYSSDRDAFVAAGELRITENIKTASGELAVLSSAQAREQTVPVYNLEAHRARSYFVGPQRLLAHNTGINCFEALRDILGTMPKAEFERLAAGWSKGTFTKLADSFRYHANKHFGDDLAKMLRKAAAFNKKGARKQIADGVKKWTRKNGEFLIEREGKIVSYGINKQ